MSEQESLLLDVGNAIGSLAILIGIFTVVTIAAVLIQSITK